MNKETWKYIIQTAIAILTAILTTLGVTSNNLFRETNDSSFSRPSFFGRLFLLFIIQSLAQSQLFGFVACCFALRFASFFVTLRSQ